MPLNEQVYDEWQLNWIETVSNGFCKVRDSYVCVERHSNPDAGPVYEVVFHYDGTREGFQDAFWAWDDQQGVPF